MTVERESLLVLKATYHPNWRASVDGVDANTVMLVSSFVGVYLSPSDHHVRLEYRPRRLRLGLLVLGFLLLPLIAVGESRCGALSSGIIVRVLRQVANSVKRRHL